MVFANRTTKFAYKLNNRITMKNLKKFSRQELKSVNGGAATCTDNVVGAPIPQNCPCPKGYSKCPNNVCVPIGQACPP
ncbi:hypothetical protein GCM10022217_19370 [Chryseobacterium ginsenosidimutans]